MEAHIFLKDGEEEKLLAVVPNLEVVPRGLYVIDDVVYRYSEQPVFIITKQSDMFGVQHVLKRVEIRVEKTDL